LDGPRGFSGAEFALNIRRRTVLRISLDSGESPTARAMIKAP
jgi:hypothetical protein